MPPRSRRTRFDEPNLGFGVGLRTVHFGHVLEKKPKVDWFEIVSENFMDTGGRPMWVLDQVAERYPIVMHGVSLSIGTVDPVDRAYLAKLKALAARVNARWISDHLCWCGVAGRNVHDLLPLPYSEECLAHCIERVKIVQDVLERPLVLENPSSYVEFKSSSMTEWEFLARLAEEADCGLLLDVNNVYVSSRNLGIDAHAFIEGVPAAAVGEIHLAGHAVRDGVLIDDHGSRVCDEVWALYRHAIARLGARPTLIEWDTDVPSLGTLLAEAARADRIVGEVHGLAA